MIARSAFLVFSMIYSNWHAPEYKIHNPLCRTTYRRRYSVVRKLSELYYHIYLHLNNSHFDPTQIGTGMQQRKISAITVKTPGQLSVKSETIFYEPMEPAREAEANMKKKVRQLHWSKSHKKSRNTCNFYLSQHLYMVGETPNRLLQNIYLIFTQLLE